MSGSGTSSTRVLSRFHQQMISSADQTDCVQPTLTPPASQSPVQSASPASPVQQARGETGSNASWTFLSNHAHVLLVLSRDPDIRVREVAQRVGITERAVQRIIADLEEGRYIERERHGRRNRYRIHAELPLRHPVESHRRVADLIQLILGS